MPKEMGKIRLIAAVRFLIFLEKIQVERHFLFFRKKGSDGMDASGSNSLTPRLCKDGSHSVFYAAAFGVK
ncbi:MAG: hypothetical protein II257_03845 [Clostridia bacterium]|nr:hypothetical protein [Clostridia bacterium]